MASAGAVHSGATAIKVDAKAYAALNLHHQAFDTTPYESVRFWINGGPEGGQRLKVQALLSDKAQLEYALPPLAPNAWQEVTVPLSALGVIAKTDMTGFWIQSLENRTLPTFYVDDVTLVAKR